MFCLKYHKMIRCIIRPAAVRFSTKFARRDNYRDLEKTLIRQTLDQKSQPTTNDWNDLRDKLLSVKRMNNTSGNVDTIILANCLPTELDTGKSYIKYLSESGQQPNPTTLINLLTLYYKASTVGREITKSDQQDIIDMYEKLHKEFPVFDATLGTGTIYGLVLTDQWRKSLEILDSIKILSKPSSRVYSAVIQRAIHEDDEQLAWNLLNNMVNDCQVLGSEVFVSYIDFCVKHSHTFTKNIDKMLTFIAENQILVTTEVTKALQLAFQKFNYNCSIVGVTKQGKCLSCQKRLRNAHVTDEEFNNLSSHFLEKVLIGSNVFSKTTPQELESFVNFINRTKPYDCVIDGLNVALSQRSRNPLALANSLASVVKYFADQGKYVLVVGRKHMQVWPKTQMNYIRRNANVFLTDNLSKDDPFFLYATLNSGSQTKFVTNDLIRDHAFKLDGNLKTTFRRWQQQYQHMIQWINDNGGVTFHEPIKFDMNAQQVDGCWHIPFENEDRCTINLNHFELRQNWLCVSEGG